MAANSLLQVRVDGKIRDEASTVLGAIGLTVSDAVRLMLRKIAQDKALPFDPLIPNETTIQAMRDARAGRVTKAENLDALFRDLNADA
jgi:DNA-damage-inducible protein J